jgi:hypothetical protein
MEQEESLLENTQDELLALAINQTIPNGQRIAAYHRLGEIFEERIQNGETATILHQEVGRRTYRIATRAKKLFEPFGLPQARSIILTTPNTLYRMGRQDFEDLIKLAKTQEFSQELEF